MIVRSVNQTVTFGAAETVKTVQILEKVTSTTEVFGIVSSIVSKITKSAGATSASAALEILLGSTVVWTGAASGVTGQQQTVLTEAGPVKVGTGIIDDGPVSLRVTLNAAPGAGESAELIVAAAINQTSFIPAFGVGSGAHPGVVRTKHMVPHVNTTTGQHD
jgi:hypothetical protein